MKKIIAIIITLLCLVPISAMDIISMNNGELFIGEILQLDINKKVEFKTQEGEFITIIYSDINQIKKVEGEANSSPSVIINNNNENNNENINNDGTFIGSSQKIAGANKEIIYDPGKKGGFLGIGYIAPTCIYRGITYNVDTQLLNNDSLSSFLAALKYNHPNMPNELASKISDLEKSLNKNKSNFYTGIALYAGAAVATLIGSSVGEKSSSSAFYVTGSVLGVGSLIPLFSIKNLSQNLKDIVTLYNYTYPNIN